MIHRILITSGKILPSIQLNKAQHHHIINVTRARNGDTIEILDGCGSIYQGGLTIISKSQSCIDQISCVSVAEKPTLSILLAGITKLNAFDLILQKATEMGVSEIQPIICEFTPVKHQILYSAERLAHWEKVIQSSVIQPRNPWLPKIQPAKIFSQISWERPTLTLHPYAENDEDTKLNTFNQVAVGPEGGWSKKELDIIHENCETVSINTPILRADTAVVAGLILIKTK